MPASALQTPLWLRIGAYSFEPGHPQNFIRRLKDEQHWSLEFARGAIEEYRRFCFLAVTAPLAVVPSEEVDGVWHLHLLYSREYWDVWCGEVLQARLHHTPTTGDAEALAWHREHYALTLLAYEQNFGPPPEAYWPATHRRFGPHRRRPVLLLPRWLRLKIPGGLVWRT